MNGIDEIINKIISDAEAQANSITQSSEARIQSMRDEADEKIKTRKEDYEKQLSFYKSETERRRTTVADLDIKKELLKKKKELVLQVFESALQKLNALDKKEYLELIGKMIEQNASDGDEVIICSKDEKVITKAFVEQIAKKKNITLKLSDKRGDFSGGIILSSDKLDKNLTFDVELKNIAEEYEAKISAMLFE